MKSGRYMLTVNGQAGYLASGCYAVEVGKHYVHFRNLLTGGECFEHRSSLHVYLRRGLLTMTPEPEV